MREAEGQGKGTQAGHWGVQNEAHLASSRRADVKSIKFLEAINMVNTVKTFLHTPKCA